METTAAPSLLPHLWKSTLVSGILAVILGILALVWPGITILVAAIFFAAYLLITGVSQLVLAFSIRSSVGGRVLLFIGGAAALVLAVLCFVSLQNSFELLAIWIGVGFIFRGVATAMSAIGDPSLPGRVWEIIIGIILIVVGVFEVISAFAIRSEAKKLHSLISPESPTVT